MKCAILFACLPGVEQRGDRKMHTHTKLEYLCVRSVLRRGLEVVGEMWCYTADDLGVDDERDYVDTSCGYTVCFTGPLEVRQATCPECLAIFEGEP